MGTVQVRVAQQLHWQAEIEAGLNSAAMQRNQQPAPMDTISQHVDNDGGIDYMDTEQWNDAEPYGVEDEIAAQDKTSTTPSGVLTAFNNLIQRMRVHRDGSSDTDEANSVDSDSSSDRDSVEAGIEQEDISVSDVEDMLANAYYDEVAGTELQIEDDCNEDIERQCAEALEGMVMHIICSCC